MLGDLGNPWSESGMPFVDGFQEVFRVRGIRAGWAKQGMDWLRGLVAFLAC